MIYETNTAFWDLTSPVSREQAGLAEGRTGAVYEKDDPDWLSMSVTLPEGRSFTGTGTTMWAAVVGETDEPNSIKLGVTGLSIAQATERMLSYAQETGVSRDEIQAWAEEAQRRADGDVLVRRVRVLPGESAGNVSVEMVASTASGEDRVGLTVAFFVGDQ